MVQPKADPDGDAWTIPPGATSLSVRRSETHWPIRRIRIYSLEVYNPCDLAEIGSGPWVSQWFCGSEGNSRGQGGNAGGEGV